MLVIFLPMTGAYLCHILFFFVKKCGEHMQPSIQYLW